MKKLFWIFTLGLILSACSKDDDKNNDGSPLRKQTTLADVQRCPAGTPDSECRSFLMTLTGRNGQPPHPNDLTYVAKAIGSLIGDLKTKNYFLFELYPAGGFQSCLDPIANGGYEAAIGVFSTFRVGAQTYWEITPVKSCTGN